MLPKLRSLLIGAALLAMGGCGGEPRLDASTKERLGDSMKAMTAAMTDGQKKEFAADCMAAAGPDMLREMMAKGLAGEKPDETTLFKSLHGLTAAEIRAKAEAFRASGPKPAG